MATRLLGSRNRVTAYLPNIQSLVRQFVTVITYDQDGNEIEKEKIGTEESNLGPFGTQDKEFPFPGKVGIAPGVLVHPFPMMKPPPSYNSVQTFFDAFPENEHKKVLDTVQNLPENDGISTVAEPTVRLECTAQDCPYILRKDFSSLFPNRDMRSGPLTVLTISHRTIFDMSGWSQEVEVEREQLLKTFIEGAIEICRVLTDFGYWADFIDPSSGTPYLSGHTNSSFFETNDGYRHLGFEIEDLGCCKVISHPVWDTHAYVGCLLTNATTDDPIFRNMKTLFNGMDWK